MKKNLLIIGVFACVFFNFKLCAQVIAGGEIYYELISSKKYKVTAHLYRMCDQSPLNAVNGNVYGGTTMVAMNFKRIAIVRINDTCGNPCNKQNTASNPGFEKHTYTDTIDFNSSPYNVFASKGICVVNFGIRQSGRSSGLTTLPSGVFYIDASVDICLTNINRNTSPEFSMEPKFKLTCNMPTTYSPGPLDTMDNDSFDFSLVDVQSNYKTNVVYTGSFSAQLPLTPFCLPPGIINCKALPNAKPPRGFYFDKNNSVFSCTPSNCGELGIIKYRIDEFRFNKTLQKHEWIGYVTREMLVEVVINTSNNAPVITTTSTLLKLCEGDKLCYTIKTADTKTLSQKVDDSTTLYWDSGIKNATFKILNPTAREKEGEFCWQTQKNNVRTEPKYFTVATYDKQCNINLCSRTFRVDVITSPKYFYKNTTGACGLVKWNVYVSDSFYPNFNATNKTVIKSFPGNQILYSGNGLKDSVNIHQDGKVIVEHIFNTYCPIVVQDTLTLSGTLIMPDINDNLDVIVCKNKSVMFNFKASRIPSLKTFNWYLNDSLINQSDTIISIAITKASAVSVLIEDNSGCKAERNVSYSLKTHQAIATIAQILCPNTLVTVNANIKTLSRPVNYSWKLNGMDTATNDSVLNFKINAGSKIILVVKDANQCEFKDSINDRMWPAVKFNFGYLNEVCKDSLASAKAFNIVATKPYTYSWQINNKSVVNMDSILILKLVNHTGFSLNIQDANGCSLQKTGLTIAVKTPEVSLKDSNYSCFNDLINIIPNIINRTAKINYQWSINKTNVSSDSVLTRKLFAKTIIGLKVSNNLNCSTEDTAIFFIYPQVPLVIKSKVNYHPSSFILLSTTKNYISYQWFNGRTTAIDSFSASDLGAPSKYKVWCRTTDLNGCEYNDTIEINTNAFLGLNGILDGGIKIYPNPVSQSLNIDLAENANLSLLSIDGKTIGAYDLYKGVNTINLSQYSSGIYFLRIELLGAHRIFKIIKQ